MGKITAVLTALLAIVIAAPLSLAAQESVPDSKDNNQSAQNTATKGQLTVWSEQGWMMKARNTGNVPLTFKFTWTTTGTNSAGEVTSTLTEESQLLILNPNEERHLFTAPQDPNKKITYVFGNIIITEYNPMWIRGKAKRERDAAD